MRRRKTPGLNGPPVAQGHVAVLAPLGDVAGHIEEAVAVGGKRAHGGGEGKAVRGPGRSCAEIGPKDAAGIRGLGPPGVGLAHQAPPGRGFPLVLGGEFMGHPGDFGQPPAEGHGVVPGDPHHRLVGAIEVFVLPVEGRLMPGGLEKPAVLGVGDFGDREIKGIRLTRWGVASSA